MLNGGEHGTDENPEQIVFFFPTMNMLPWKSCLYAGSGTWGNKVRKEQDKRRKKKMIKDWRESGFVSIFLNYRNVQTEKLKEDHKEYTQSNH